MHDIMISSILFHGGGRDRSFDYYSPFAPPPLFSLPLSPSLFYSSVRSFVDLRTYNQKAEYSGE